MNIRILCIGDVSGATGRVMFAKHISSVKSYFQADMIIVNGENAADDGRGIMPKHAQFLKEHGATVITSGNHIFAKKEIYSYLNDHTNFLLRPANFPSETPGVGLAIVQVGDVPVAVINVQGRVFMKELLDCPFKTATSLLTYVRDKAKVVIVDFHAETTAEKAGLANYLDGKVSAVFGTHTHVQTADERILPHGTGFITDVGMVGAQDSMLGMKKEPIIYSLITQLPVRFAVQTNGPAILNGIIFEVDANTGKTVGVERVSMVDVGLQVDGGENV